MSKAPARVAVTELHPCAMFANGPRCTSAGVFSIVCGLAPSLGILVVARVFQGLCGGPLMPLSQTLLMRIFPKEKAAAAIGLTVLAFLLGGLPRIAGGLLLATYGGYLWFMG